MTISFEVKALPRPQTGKGASRRLRHAKLVPGILYGGGDGKKPLPFVVSLNELEHHLAHEAFYSSILDFDLEGRKEQVVLKDLQRHPSKLAILHLDLLRVSETATIRMQVPLHFVGEEAAPGVKEGGTVSHHLNELEITCLPKDLPEYIDVDISQMGMGDSQHLFSLTLPDGVDLPARSLGPDYDVPVVSVHSLRGVAEEDEEETPEQAEEGGIEVDDL